jgi:hypothetical protein
VVLAAALALTPTALADSGAGLYLPFPDLSRQKPAQKYLGRIGLSTTPERLRAGMPLGPFAAPVPAAATGPGARAGLGTHSTSTGLVLAIAVVLVAIASIAVRLARR